MGAAQLLNVDHSRVRIDFAGLNHLVYGLDVFVDGVSVKDELLKKLTDKEKSITMKNIHAMGWEPEFLQALNVLPCPYHNYYYKTREMVEEEVNAASEGGTRAEVVKKLEEELFQLYQNPDLAEKPPQLEKGVVHTTVMRHAGSFIPFIQIKGIYSRLTLEIMVLLQGCPLSLPWKSAALSRKTDRSQLRSGNFQSQSEDWSNLLSLLKE